MNIDLYTKTVLTVIAVALCVIVFQQGLGSAVALGDGCGDINNPCFVETGIKALEVSVSNLPLFQ